MISVDAFTAQESLKLKEKSNEKIYPWLGDHFFWARPAHGWLGGTVRRPWPVEKIKKIIDDLVVYINL